MNWWTANQKRIGLQVDTVADLIKALQQCPQDWKVRDADEGRFCEICVATDGTEKLVELY